MGVPPAKFHEKPMPKVGHASACQPAGRPGFFGLSTWRSQRSFPRSGSDPSRSVSFDGGFRYLTVRRRAPCPQTKLALVLGAPFLTGVPIDVKSVTPSPTLV